jgi:lysyl-tRNA synthetase class 2
MALSEQENIRRENFKPLRNLESILIQLIFSCKSYSKQIKSQFEEGKKVIVAVVWWVRDQGKACFAELQDSEGRIQLYVNRCCVKVTINIMYNQVF